MTDKTCVALGTFDGLHLGHIRVLNDALRLAENRFAPVCLLFDRHPHSAISGKRVPSLITPEDRKAILEQMGFDIRTLVFDDVRDMSPRDFFNDVLLGRLNAGAVACGYNYTFGKFGAGDVEKLKSLCAESGVEVSVAPEISVDGRSVSSTAVRRAISEGDVSAARAMLGRPFGFSTRVFHGDGRGRRLGAPTVNQLIPDGLAVPRYGVYCSTATIHGQAYPAVTNIGCRPTFDGDTVRSETFIFDFGEDLYESSVRLELYEFLRPEIRFCSPGELESQIARDCEVARNYFGIKRL